LSLNPVWYSDVDGSVGGKNGRGAGRFIVV